MSKLLTAFLKNEDGLVTVEWVALASALVVGAIAIGWLVLGQMKTEANKIGGDVTSTNTSQKAANGF